MEFEDRVLHKNPRVINYNDDIEFKVSPNADAENINLAYFNTPKLSPSNNVNITNNNLISTEIREGQSIATCYIPDQSGRLILKDNNDINTVSTDELHLTDITVEKNGNEIPLFYSYKLRYKHLDVADYSNSFTNIKEKINILNEDKKPVDESLYSYKLEVTDFNLDEYESTYEVIIYTNFTVDKSQSFYVDYTPDCEKLPSDYMEVLNTTPIFTETDSRLEFDKNNSSCKKYFIQETNNGNYKVFVPTRTSKDELYYHNTTISHKPYQPVGYEINLNNYSYQDDNEISFTLCSDKTLDNKAFIDGFITGTNSYLNSNANSSNIEEAYYKMIEYTDTPEDNYVFPEEGYSSFPASLEQKSSEDKSKLLPAIEYALSAYQQNLYDLYRNQKVIVSFVDSDIADDITEEKLSNLETMADNVELDQFYLLYSGSKNLESLQELTDRLNRTTDSDRMIEASTISIISLRTSILNDISQNIQERKILEGQTTLDFDLDIIKQINYALPNMSELDIEDVTLRYKTGGHDENQVELDLYDGEQNKIDATRTSLSYEDGKVTEVIKYIPFDKIEDKELYIGGRNNIRTDHYSRKYYIKLDSLGDSIYSRLDKDLTRRNNWYLDIKNGSYLKEETPIKTAVFSGDEDKRVYQIKDIINDDDVLDELIRVVVVANYPNIGDNYDFLEEHDTSITSYADRFAHIGLDYIYPENSRDIEFTIKESSDRLVFEEDEVKIIDSEQGLIKFSHRPYCGQNNIFVTFRCKNTKQFYYSIPEFNYQDFQDQDKKTLSDNHTAKIEGRHLDLRNEPLCFDVVEQNDLKIPDNIETDLDTEIINWNKYTGDIYLRKNPNQITAEVEYLYKTDWYKYTGYYDKNDNFIHLDLNPAFGHTYTDPDTLEKKPTSNLYDKTIRIYIKPEYTANKSYDIKDNKYKTKIIEGSRNTHTLFHTIDEKLEAEDVELISKIYISADGIDQYEIQDSRSRGGGIKDWLVDDLKDIHEDIKYYWDIGTWDGTVYPKSGAVIVELPETVLDNFTKAEVREKIEEHLALGIYPVIRYV